MEEKSTKKHGLEELKDLYLFDELFRFIRRSTGITLAIAYLVLLLSSMSYLHIVYSSLDLNILQFVTFEDILATPIKNPDIVITFFLLFIIFYFADIGNRYRVRIEEKYTDDNTPFYAKILKRVFWAPKKRRANIRTTYFTIALSLVIYVVTFAWLEAKDVKNGAGSMVEVTFADNTPPIKTTLLGTTSNYVITYDYKLGESTVFYVESIQSIKKLKLQAAASEVTSTPAEKKPVSPETSSKTLVQEKPSSEHSKSTTDNVKSESKKD
ncbi:MAG: hypothetical protein CL811_08305 [Colwelliaceae bacterium]|nr:hypothetical protein [Colwelliaceae bacterium]|tara:strand:+ start:769 stop:1572 length:804 start_codon:yes stop_codon:yes gene_type:complete